MKNENINIKDKIISRYFEKKSTKISPKSTNINVLLNRVKNNQKNEIRKKMYFSAAASAGCIPLEILSINKPIRNAASSD